MRDSNSKKKRIGGDFLRLARNDEKRTLFLKRIQKQAQKTPTRTASAAKAAVAITCMYEKKKKITSENK